MIAIHEMSQWELYKNISLVAVLTNRMFFVLDKLQFYQSEFNNESVQVLRGTSLVKYLAAQETSDSWIINNKKDVWLFGQLLTTQETSDWSIIRNPRDIWLVNY